MLSLLIIFYNYWHGIYCRVCLYPDCPPPPLAEGLHRPPLITVSRVRHWEEPYSATGWLHSFIFTGKLEKSDKVRMWVPCQGHGYLSLTVAPSWLCKGKASIWWLLSDKESIPKPARWLGSQRIQASMSCWGPLGAGATSIRAWRGARALCMPSLWGGWVTEA